MYGFHKLKVVFLIVNGVRIWLYRNRFHSELENGEAEKTIFNLHFDAVDQVNI